MGRSPGKWIKTLLLGKKSSKSKLSKDATKERNVSTAAKGASGDLDVDSLVISNPIPHTTNMIGEDTELSEGAIANSTDAGIMLLPSNDEAELSRQDNAATMAQAAFRGYLARRAFKALKGIIRLQALVRGHLVRRQAVATLRCMRAIVEFQAIVRGRRIRLNGIGSQGLIRSTQAEQLDTRRGDLLGTSLTLEKLSTNAFGSKLLASSRTTMPLSLHYDPVEPNSVTNWLERWSSSHFWEPLGRPKKSLDAKPKRKQTKLQTEETEAGRPKRSVRRIAATSSENTLLHPSEIDKSKRSAKKLSSQQAEQPQEQPFNELEKVKRNLRKISLSTSVSSEKSEAGTEKQQPQPTLEKTLDSPTPIISEQEKSPPSDDLSDLNVAVCKLAEQEAPPILLVEEKPNGFVTHEASSAIEPNAEETTEKTENKPLLNEDLANKEDQASKENPKTRRKSFPAKQEFAESVSPLQKTPTLPSYMAATESAKAKLKVYGSQRTAEDGAENGFVRRHSLPSTNGKISLHSPRFQRPVQANGKGGSKSSRALASSRDEKALQAGWKR